MQRVIRILTPILTPILTGAVVLTAVLWVEAAPGAEQAASPQAQIDVPVEAPVEAPVEVSVEPLAEEAGPRAALGAMAFLDIALPPPPAPLPAPQAEAQAETEQLPKPLPKPEQVADFAKPEKPKAIRPMTSPMAPPVAPDSTGKTRTPKLIAPKAPETTTPRLSMPKIERIERVVRPSRNDTEIGAELLAVMERGEGPGIKIGWPARKAGRDQLRVFLERCADRRVLLSAGQSLWSLDEEPGESWMPSPETSGYMRILGGTEEAVSRDQVDRIRQRHSIAGGQAVAVVSRAFDARLLGGLAALVGRETLQTQSVGGRYRMENDLLQVVDISVDGAPVGGRVDVMRGGRCG